MRYIPLVLALVLALILGYIMFTPGRTTAAPPGEKIVYTDTDGSAGTTTLWSASVANPAARVALANITHKPGYSIRGAVSPDGSLIAYLAILPGASEQAARTGGGEIWVVAADGTDLHRVAVQVGAFVEWSPDSKSLIYSRIVEQPTAGTPQPQEQIEIYLAAVDGGSQRLLASGRIEDGVQPIGFAAGGQEFYYARLSPQRSWQIWAVNPANMSSSQHLAIPAQYNIQSITLTPDRTRFVLRIPQGRDFNLVTLSLDGQSGQTIFHGVSSQIAPLQSEAIWSPDGKQLLTFNPPQPGAPAHLESINLQSGQHRQVAAQPQKSPGSQEYLLPRSISPDGQWVALAQYPRSDFLVYLMPAQGGTPVQIPSAKPSNWVSIAGWINR